MPSKYLVALTIMILFIITGCGGDEDAPSTSAPATIHVTDTLPSTDVVSPTLEPALRLTLEPQYDELVTAQQAISEIWQNLQAGRGVACNTQLPVLPSPDVYQSDDEITNRFFEAAVNLQEAYRLWNTECLNPRPQPPPEIIDQGLRAALSAGDRLREAETFLTR
jgi:hypothetical protein